MITIKVEGFDVKVRKLEDGNYYGEIEELPGCDARGKSLKKLKNELKAAAAAYLMALASTPLRKPRKRKETKGNKGDEPKKMER